MTKTYLTTGRKKPLALWRKAKKKRLDLHADYPSYVPLLPTLTIESYARRWLLRAKGFQNNELDNQ
jgi:hypothetical protein